MLRKRQKIKPKKQKKKGSNTEIFEINRCVSDQS